MFWMSFFLSSSEGFIYDSLDEFLLGWEKDPALGSSDEASLEDINTTSVMVHSNEVSCGSSRSSKWNNIDGLLNKRLLNMFSIIYLLMVGEIIYIYRLFDYSVLLMDSKMVIMRYQYWYLRYCIWMKNRLYTWYWWNHTWDY